MENSSRIGLPIIKAYEGCKLTAYICPAGILTIGWGETKGVTKGQTITQAQADSMLATRYAEFEAGVLSLTKVPLNQNQLGALVSFAYNVGLASLASSTLLRKINARDFIGAAAEFARWNKAAGKVMAGLSKRRASEAALFQSAA